MKTVLAAGSVLALGALVYGGRMWVQAAPLPARKAEKAPQTRIALLNLTYVLKNYQKFVKFQEEMKEAIDPFGKRDRELKEKVEELAKQLQDEKLPQKQRGEVEKKRKQLQKEIEDNQAAAKEFLGKKGDEQMKILYMDIAGVCERHAKAHGIDLVLHYNDATTNEDLLSPQNIARKLQAGTLMPVYAAEGLDISKDIVEALNKKEKADS